MKKKILLTALSLSFAASVFAAENGTLGSTSTGDLDIQLNIANLIRISGLHDLTLNTEASDGTNGFDRAVGHVNFCVYANNGLGTFDITAAGDHTGAFTLTDGGKSVIAYQVNFAGSRVNSNSIGGVSLAPGVPYAATGASLSVGSLTCANASDETSTIWVSVPGTTLEGKPAANYAGTLRLTIAAK